MNQASTYVAKPADKNGIVPYTEAENQIWAELIARQTPLVKERACDEYLQGLALLHLPNDHIPQCKEVSRVLKKETGWALEMVPAIIPANQFFSLLSQRKFPAATFIRRREELNYLREPDMFHELFGHCPLLTNQAYADFAHTYGKLALTANEEDREMLARLYWFTIEFGLIKTKEGLRIYGGGILSSLGETPYSLESPIPIRKPFDVIEALRTPYRIDIMQPVYFIIDSFDVLYHLIDQDLLALIKQARKLGMHKPLFA